ncbi:MAG TPA: ABC transporter permease, partial [Vicinamibacterales bacterium]|nr:ABC transporter permease [Vicinamibacterales bacterium]
MPLELRHAFRAVFKNPRFTLVAVAALALGVGANTAIFSVVNAVLLQPLPYPDSGHLVRLCRTFQGGQPGCSISIPKYMAWSRAEAFDAIALYDQGGPGVTIGGAQAEQVPAIHVSAGYFRVFGALPTIGRAFSAQEDAPNGPHVVVISHHLWRSRFESNPAIVGQTITLNGDSYVIVGVTPQRFRADPAADVFIPLQADPDSTNQGHYLSVAAHLKPGVALDVARAEVRAQGERFRHDNPKWMGKEEGVSVYPMLEIAVGDVRPALLILLGAVGLVLLIACANVANLLLARAAGRQREIAIRSAIGAGRGRIVRQLLLESLILAAAGAVAGVIVGVWGARAIVALSPADLPRIDDFAQASFVAALLDLRIVAFTVLVSLTTAVLFGLAPALQLSRADLAATLKDAGGRGSTSRRAARTRAVLVVAETALALMLLVGATLLARTFVALRAVHPGFDPHGVVTLHTSLSVTRYASARNVDAFARAAVTRLDAIPGVEASAMALFLPTAGGADLPFTIAGRPLPSDSLYHGDEDWRSITPQYFGALAIPLLRGRLFDDHDAPSSAPALIVNAAFVKKYFPKEDAIGRQVTIGHGLGPEFEDPTRTIVGVVGDVHENGLEEAAPPILYVPVSQVSDGLTRLANGVVPPSWIVKTSAPSAGITPAIRQAFAEVDSQLAIADVRSMDAVVARSISRQNFNMTLLTVFGAIALLLAAVGVYGIMSYSVEQATHDISVRLALGAGPRQILHLVVGSGMKLAGAGLAIGVAAAFGASRVLAKLLYGVKSTDPTTYAIAAAALGVIA